MQNDVVIRRIVLEVLKGSFILDFEGKVAVQSFVAVQFENGVSAAIKSTMALAGHEQVVAEFSLLQLWCRANKVRCA